MPVTLTVPYRKSIPLDCSSARAKEALGEFHSMIENNFPGIEKLANEGGSVFSWQFKTLNYSGYSLKIEFRTEFKAVSNTKIQIIPVGNSKTSLSGAFEVTDLGCKPSLNLEWTLSIEAPIPGLMKGMAETLARKELTKLFDEFSDNVKQNLK